MLWEHRPQASVSAAFNFVTCDYQNVNSLLEPSLRQQLALVLCLHLGSSYKNTISN